MDLTTNNGSGGSGPVLLVAGLIVVAGAGLGLLTRPTTSAGEKSAASAAVTGAPVPAPEVTVQRNEVMDLVDQGHILCFSPNMKAKTCEVMVKYRKNFDGSWHEEATILLDRRGPIDIQIVGKVYLKDGKICTTVPPNPANTIRIRIDGSNISPKDYQQIYNKQVKELAPLVGKEGCSTVTRKNGLFYSSFKIDGVDRRFRREVFAVVKADAGFDPVAMPQGRSYGS
ncbi:hypothetical protein PbB2_02624 [Candidatus Phycosocius bacilliformis]|uniref:Uncharacterized protein n=1 Tax=Candidatus Phycosocius bacilliformis TaxID=1445552 RepID=A0A2P2ECZ6_9PROT|nr:hypothetical protein [Candidatus Phycosocius bacilliformis]GBF58933.1 hypothetical protein PbB2_02624 [Candidatus Phycosocius bacilliformis]